MIDEGLWLVCYRKPKDQYGHIVVKIQDASNEDNALNAFLESEVGIPFAITNMVRLGDIKKEA